MFDWHKAEKRLDKKSVEAKIFNKHKKLIQIRKAHAVFCLFNYSNQNQSLPESIFEASGKGPHKFKELWTNSSL